MQVQQSINQIIASSETGEKIEAARNLTPFLHEPRVMEALCEAALTTTSQRLRHVLIDVLRSRSDEAYKRFSDEALWSKSPTVRKWALVNLRMMECRDAKNAVISGLYDPDASVREAAMQNVELYADNGVRMAFDYYSTIS